jgi:hypothetical protein
MGKIVVAKLHRLGKDGDKFSEKFKTTIRDRVVIDEDYVKEFNRSLKTRGQMYEIDPKATKDRDSILNPKKSVEPTK